MATILNKKPKEPLIFDFTCPHCGCLARYNKDEIKIMGYMGKLNLAYKCPSCGSYITIELNEPENIKNYIVK